MSQPWLTHAIEQFDKDGFKDGDVLSHDWIKWALEIPAPSASKSANEAQFMLLHRFDAFREYLLIERKIALRSMWGKGYWIVPPGEQAQVAAEEAMRLIKRGLDKGDKILTHARLGDMTMMEAARHTNVQIKIGGLKSLVSRQRKDVFAAFEPPKSIAAS